MEEAWSKWLCGYTTGYCNSKRAFQELKARTDHDPWIVHDGDGRCHKIRLTVARWIVLCPKEIGHQNYGEIWEVRGLFSSHGTMETWGNSPIRSVCGGFLFLRILLPALTLPHLYGVSKNVSPDARSVLVACCRVLQTAANCVGGRDLDYLATQDAIGVDQARTLTDAMDGLMEAVLVIHKCPCHYHCLGIHAHLAVNDVQEDGIYDRDEGDVQRTSSGTKAATAIARSLAVWGSYLSGFTDFQRDMKRVGFGLQLPPVLWDSEMVSLFHNFPSL